MYATSTMSTTTSSSHALMSAAAERRVRVVRLLRPRRAAPAFGFSLRGGKEYATGFFISKVELNSEAHLQGLKVGDQVISVNGFRVDDAIHAELVHYITSQARLKIKVRHVGMIPIKEKDHESLSWQFISERASLTSDVSSSPTICHNTDHLTDMRLSILVPPRAKLGCGICKGPEWKPGIFVQFIREGGIAREAGLRPGDQILSCNGLDFGNISFNEAIAAMKVSGRLELVIREGAGTELVSPESSGYNSSASSAAGERSPAPAVQGIPLAPPAALRRRLASVAEEAADRADRLTINRIKRRTWDSLDFDWKINDVHNFDAPSDIEPDYDSPSIPNNPHTFENKASIKTKPKSEYETTNKGLNRTIINLTEDGATIQCSYDNNTSNYNRKNHFISNRTNQREDEKKTIVVEVHHLDTNSYSKTHCSYPPPPKKEINDNTSMSSSNTLSSAIAEEIQRRKLNMKKPVESEVVPAVTKKPNVIKAIDTDQKKHHDALMDEFKKVHRKMFLNQESVEVNNLNVKENHIDATDRQVNTSVRKDCLIAPEFTNGNTTPDKCEVDHKPPPPPPMPTENGHKHENGSTLKRDIYDSNIPMKIPNMRKIATLTRIPTPDYNNKNDSLSGKSKIQNSNAEVDSLESYKLKNPENVKPKPPSNYFIKAPNGTETMKKHSRPVSVTIGQYVNNIGGRKEPSKLEFLNGEKKGHQITDNEPISSRLQSELALTLSRSNLRKKTEALGDGGR